MKPRLIAICALAALLVVAGCTAAASGNAAVTISCDEFQKEAHLSREVGVPVGSTLTVDLCSNPSTGYAWEEPKVANEAVMQQTGHEVKPAQGGAIGAPGSEQWTFKAGEKGTSTVSFAYSRPWEGGEKGTWTLELTVIAQ
ncbi:MAG TPA: protease inhibitor I42 family protein [Anaerolineae bacterium]|nr:protease inhibitor I42 family protein [Anaerolineae bacterium]HOQ99594.1 protease inhibitor I42 family protein [Anaerolineae bacterium]HPL30382.1 protease inhibitor I42 family protein [Anaerolineae bacterium]